MQRTYARVRKRMRETHAKKGMHKKRVESERERIEIERKCANCLHLPLLLLLLRFASVSPLILRSLLCFLLHASLLPLLLMRRFDWYWNNCEQALILYSTVYITIHYFKEKKRKKKKCFDLYLGIKITYAKIFAFSWNCHLTSLDYWFYVTNWAS